MSTATKVTSLAEIMGDSGVIVYVNAGLHFVWDRKRTIEVWDSTQKRAASDSGGWGWMEYDLHTKIEPGPEDVGVHKDTAWAIDKAAEWYEEHEREF
jgi:hypothetical protein